MVLLHVLVIIPAVDGCLGEVLLADACRVVACLLEQRHIGRLIIPEIADIGRHAALRRVTTCVDGRARWHTTGADRVALPELQAFRGDAPVGDDVTLLILRRKAS